MRAYAGDELEAQLEHALVRAVLEHDVVRRRLHLQELQLAALADDLADVHPAKPQCVLLMSDVSILFLQFLQEIESIRSSRTRRRASRVLDWRTWFRRRRCLR